MTDLASLIERVKYYLVSAVKFHKDPLLLLCCSIFSVTGGEISCSDIYTYTDGQHHHFIQLHVCMCKAIAAILALIKHSVDAAILMELRHIK